MITKLKKDVCRSFRNLLSLLADGDSIEECEELKEALSDLEYYLPNILSEKYDFWRNESLDGLYAAKALKIGHNEVELLGMSILITDQTLIPFYVSFSIADSSDYIEWLNCKIGELGQEGLIKIPYHSGKWKKKLYSLNEALIDWAYEITIPIELPSMKKDVYDYD
ncbi:MAG: hypothetical protein GY749_07500 [Desulfobacteraceae bacterium]|nr:hypothetical protein [Desulfobacteraceae bacterium]